MLQAVWMKYVGISGLAITKMDGTARGFDFFYFQPGGNSINNVVLVSFRGFVVSVVHDLGVPIKFIGVGEKIQDLRDFQPEV